MPSSLSEMCIRDSYKVKGEEKTYLIPAVKDIFITDIDEEAREISVHMIEGLETDED